MTANNNNNKSGNQDDFLSAFDDLLNAINDTTTKTVTVKPSYLDSLADDVKTAFIVSDVTYKEPIKLEKEGTTFAPERNRPERLKPRAGKHGDNFSSARNKARTLFINSTIALAAQNKGKIALIDLLALHKAFNVSSFISRGTSNDLKSLYEICGDLHRKLNRAILTDGEHLTIVGLKEDRELATWCKAANVAVAIGRAQFNAA